MYALRERRQYVGQEDFVSGTHGDRARAHADEESLAGNGRRQGVEEECRGKHLGQQVVQLEYGMRAMVHSFVFSCPEYSYISTRDRTSTLHPPRLAAS